MKKAGVFWVLLTMAMPVFAQTRDDIHIYIPSVMSSDPSHVKYFKDNFEMETIAAGYNLTNDSRNADYTLHLEVQPNMILYDDGTTEPAPPEEGQYLLQINLLRNEDNVEIVAFSFPFTNVEEMYEYNLYLLYEAMANVPLTKATGEAGVEIDDRWKNKWLYLRTSFDFPITYYNLKPDNLSGGQPLLTPSDPEKLIIPKDDGDDERMPAWKEIQALYIDPKPAATIGLELQYLNWMSTEFNFQLRFGDPMSSTFIPAIQIQQKFVIKPSTHFMIEPYGFISFPLATSENLRLPTMAAGGGFQFGVKGGSMGAFFVDLNVAVALGDAISKNTNPIYDIPANLHYFNMIIGLGIGFKIGFIDRETKAQPVAPSTYSLIPPPPVSIERGDDFDITEEIDSAEDSDYGGADESSF